MVNASIRYQRIRVPRDHQSVLQIPPATDWPSLWHENQASARARTDLWTHWQSEARQEITQLAKHYTSSYLSDSELSWLDNRSEEVMMSGHQPELYHPGVWYKNFCLSSQSQHLQATPINLIVDSDLAARSSIAVPQVDPNDRVIYGSIAYDASLGALPHECRKLIDLETFKRFPDEVRVVMQRYNGTKNPIAESLWKEALAIRNSWEAHQADAASLGNLLAAARHRIERGIGLKTLELPVSIMAQSRSFAHLFQQIALDIRRFQAIYNEVLTEYRKVHGIRSTAHPVPALTQSGDSEKEWLEAPFWIWSDHDSRRRPLFLATDASSISISNQAGIEIRMERDGFTDSFQTLATNGIAIRPRALMTTMFARMLVSDLFLHGIGGAKYDQLTDAMAFRFFGIELPQHATLSASYWLATDRKITLPQQLRELQILQREQRFHPEKHVVDSPQAAELIRQKQQLIKRMNHEGRSKMLHDMMERVNTQLKSHVPLPDPAFGEQRRQLREAINESELLRSREFSYCLYDEGLIDWLREVAC